MGWENEPKRYFLWDEAVEKLPIEDAGIFGPKKLKVDELKIDNRYLMPIEEAIALNEKNRMMRKGKIFQTKIFHLSKIITKIPFLGIYFQKCQQILLVLAIP